MTTYLECGECGCPASRKQEMERDTICNECGGRLTRTIDAMREMHEPEYDEEEREEEL